MKIITPLSLLVGTLFLFISPLPSRAQLPARAPNNFSLSADNVTLTSPNQTRADHVASFRFVLQPRMVKAAYLGLTPVACDAVLQAQLRLPEGVGLSVLDVDGRGPSNGLVKRYDVLYKFDDQLAVNVRQLLVLVRMHKAGDSVELTVIREGQPVKVAVKLVEKEQAEMSAFDAPQEVHSGTVQVDIPPGATLMSPGNVQNLQIDGMIYAPTTEPSEPGQ